MVKIKKSSDELNRSLSCVYISPGHAASFRGLHKLYRAAKNQFPSLTRKEIKNGQKVIFPIHYTNSLEEPSNETRYMLLKLIVYGKLIWLLYKMELKKMME